MHFRTILTDVIILLLIIFLLILVSISFDNYRTIHPGILESDSTSSDEDLDYDEDDKTKQSGKNAKPC